MKGHILVVDDDETILEALRLMLEQAEYTVETSTKNGHFLQQKIKKKRPSLILLDVLLSGQDGRHIAKELKSNEETMDIPLIMMSAHPNAEKTAFAAGADDFIPKPFDIYNLLEKIEDLIKGNPL